MLRNPKRMTYIVLPLLVLIVTIYTSTILYFYDLTRFVAINSYNLSHNRLLLNFSESSNFDELYYSVTHTRMAPWLLGLMFGTFMLDFKTNEQKYRIKRDVDNVN